MHSYIGAKNENVRYISFLLSYLPSHFLSLPIYIYFLSMLFFFFIFFSCHLSFPFSVIFHSLSLSFFIPLLIPWKSCKKMPVRNLAPPFLIKHFLWASSPSSKIIIHCCFFPCFRKPLIYKESFLEPPFIDFFFSLFLNWFILVPRPRFRKSSAVKKQAAKYFLHVFH